SPLLAATLGGLLATWVTFAPCFLWIFLGAPYVERLRGNRALSGALAAISAAVVGVILNLALWFAIHAVFGQVAPVAAGPLRFDVPVLASADPWALALSVAACIAVLRFKSGVLSTLGVAAGIGIALRLSGLH
ncbi:chromate transporter, partial [Sphingomonas sp.]|uniref:chromate transporter n=1 Tax=Sphingomonas sp. TaxID=28214 RepID=UPI003340408B